MTNYLEQGTFYTVSIDRQKFKDLLKVDTRPVPNLSESALAFSLYLDIEPGSIIGHNKETDSRVAALVIVFKTEVPLYTTLLTRLMHAEHALEHYLLAHEWTELQAISVVEEISGTQHKRLDTDQMSAEQFTEVLRQENTRLGHSARKQQ